MSSSSPSATLPAVATVALIRAKDALRRGDGVAAERDLAGALALAPRNAEIQRLLGSALAVQGRYAEAVTFLCEAIALQPDDALAHNSLGNVLGRLGDKAGAAAAFARACELAPGLAPLWYNHAKALCENLQNEEALPVLDRAVQLAPGDPRVRFLRANTLRVTGRTRQAAAVYRQILRDLPTSAEAWLGLANLKGVRFDGADVAAMERAARSDLSVDDQNSIRFALARGYEDVGRYDAAFRAYVDGNACVRRHHPWNAAGFSAHMQAILAAFAERTAASNGQGGEVIFIVSLPRAGSSLTEQILASHPQICGAGELLDLPAVLHEESQRRGLPLSAWAAHASAADWQRLGETYLARTARWRASTPRFTDKLPDNWRYVGAALAMLPEARVVICRRDPLETALACFRQLFAGGGQPFSYDLDDIAAYLHDFDCAVARWVERHPMRTHVQDHEALVADAEGQIRALLDFCGLPFDARCLSFHETERTVRTASAGQVREPLRRDTARAAKYGRLLDALRAALGVPPFTAPP